MGTASGTYGQALELGNVISCQAAGLDLGTAYYFAVTAVDSASPPNESGPSDEVSATTASNTRSGGDIPQGQMSVVSASSDATNAAKVLDGDSATRWGPSGGGPHEMVLDLGGSYAVSAFRYLPHSWTKCTQYEVYVSATNGNWGIAVATGTWANDSTEKTVSFPATTGAYLRVRYLDNYCYAAEHNVVAGGS